MMTLYQEIIEFITLWPYPVRWLDILTAIVCGATIGFERQVRGKPAGIRTSTLVCLGTCAFIRLGAEATGGTTDASRVLGQVITGIGFLGAGLMLARDGGQITGITSATVIWILAAIGALIGSDYHSGAILITFVVVAVLTCTELLEHFFRSLQRGIHHKDKNSDSN